MVSNIERRPWLRPCVRAKLTVSVVVVARERSVLWVLQSVTAVPSLTAVLVECAVAVL